MKKILTGIFILTIILLLMGCAKETEVTTPTTPTEEPATTGTESEIDAGVTEIEEMEEDLYTDDLDTIGDDLAEIDW